MNESDTTAYRRRTDKDISDIKAMFSTLSERTAWISNETKKCLLDRNELYTRVEKNKESVEILKVKQSLFFWVGGVMVSLCTLICGGAASRWLYHLISNSKTPHL